MNFLRLSPEGRFRGRASSAKYEIRVRSGRDEKVVANYLFSCCELLSVTQQICHLDRSVGQWRDLQFLGNPSPFELFLQRTLTQFITELGEGQKSLTVLILRVYLRSAWLITGVHAACNV
jgi:hypothetical protein